MKPERMGIVWPSLGHPERVDLGPQGGECLVLARRGGRQGLTAPDVRGRLITVGRPGEVLAPELEVLAVTERRLASVSGPGRWSDWVLRHAPEVVELRFRIPAMELPGPRRSLLCDLEITIAGEVHRRPGAIFLRRQGTDAVHLLVASDVHVATRWDSFVEDVARFFPAPSAEPPEEPHPGAFDPREVWSADAIVRSFVNPNRNLAQLIRIANQLAERGEIDALFLTGDLVDYKFQRPRAESGDGYQDTEWPLLTRILLGQVPYSERLRVPLFTATGNHDYRLYPYRFQIYGLRHCGIADEITREYLRRSGRLLRIPYRLGELDAVRVNLGDRHSLEYYYRDFNPFDDYRVDFGQLRIVVLDSGSDLLCHQSHLRSPRWRRYLGGLKRAVGEPSSNGLTSEQVRYLRDRLGERPGVATLVVTHAPVLNPGVDLFSDPRSGRGPSLPVGVAAPPLPAADTRASVALEKRLAALGLSPGALFQNQVPTLSAMAAHQGPVVVVSGHTHRALELALDKNTGELQAGELTREGDLAAELESRVLLLQTPALGHVKRGNLRRGLPAYRILRFADHNIRQVPLHPLRAAPFEQWSYDWERVSARGREETLRFYFDRQGPPAEQQREIRHRVVCWLRPRKGKVSTRAAARVQILPRDHSAVETSRDRRRPADGGYVSFLLKDVSTWDITVRNRSSNLKVAFVFETFEQVEGKLQSLGLRRHHRDLR